mgnify:CR=1 FL=1
MGKIKPDLAGAYVSKVGGVAYYIKDGVNYVRSLIQYSLAGRSEGQIQIRLANGGANEGNRQSGFSSAETGNNA